MRKINMKQEFEFGGNKYKIELPKDFETKLAGQEIKEWMMDWLEASKKVEKKEEEDIWFETPLIPGYKFKNLEFKVIDLENQDVTQLNLNMSYDKIEKIDEEIEDKKEKS